MSRRDELIRALAEFLSRDLGRKSIELEMGRVDARDWAKLYQLSGCHGYATAEETETAIRRTLAESEVAA